MKLSIFLLTHNDGMHVEEKQKKNTKRLRFSQIESFWQINSLMSFLLPFYVKRFPNSFWFIVFATKYDPIEYDWTFKGGNPWKWIGIYSNKQSNMGTTNDRKKTKRNETTNENGIDPDLFASPVKWKLRCQRI